MQEALRDRTAERFNPEARRIDRSRRLCRAARDLK